MKPLTAKRYQDALYYALERHLQATEPKHKSFWRKKYDSIKDNYYQTNKL